MKTTRLFLLAACATLAAQARVLVEEPDEIFIATRRSHEWVFSMTDADKGRVTVEFRHRIDFPKLGGWCPCWQIEVNGQMLTAAATRRATRLLNKPYSLNHRHHGRFVADNGSDKWYSLYLPDFHAADELFSPATSEATRVVLDISDRIRTGTNTVTLRVHVPRANYVVHNVKDRKPALAINGFKICVDAEPSNLSRVVEKEIRAVFRTPPKAKFALEKSEDKLRLSLNGGLTPIISRFTVPGGQWVEMGTRETLETPYYSVERRIVPSEGRIDFFDTFTSKSDKLIGIKIRYEVPLAGYEPVYVAGDPSPGAVEFAGGRNPSVFGVDAERGCGVALLAQDDVFRAQNVQYCQEGKFGIRTDGLALKPGEARVVEWSVYPVASTDYFDFVNAVRRDWDVNFRIDGVFTFSLNNYASYTKAHARRNQANESIVMQSFPAHYWNHLGGKYAAYNGNIWGMGKNAKRVRVRINATESILEDPEIMNAFERKCIARCRKFTPDIKVMTYIHNQICVDADDDKYEEARMIDARGRRMFFGSGEAAKIFLPTVDNAYGRDFLKLVDWYFDNFDLDGIYLDEVSHCNSRFYGGDAYWDGVTVELDEQFNIKRKLSFVSLLKLDFTLAFFDQVINQRGKLLVGNFSPETRSERKFKFPRFEETYNARWIALSHLYTPIQLGDMLTYANTPKDMAADQRMALMRGALYYHYVGNTGCPSLTSKMYPFTPQEIHAGWLVGEERILTAVSGEFGWPGKDEPVNVYVYNELGRLVPGYPYETAVTPRGRVIRLELKKDHCAAIVRAAMDLPSDEGKLIDDTSSYARDSGTISATACDGGIEVRHSGKRDWSVGKFEPFAVKPGDVLAYTCTVVRAENSEKTGTLSPSVILRDAKDNVIDWAFASTGGRATGVMSATFAIPHGAVTAEPRIVGTGPFAGRVTGISFTRAEKSLDLAKESSLKLAAAGIEVSLSGRDGSFTVKDQRSGRHWESRPPATAYLVTALSQPSTQEVVLDLVQTTTLQRFRARYTLEGSGELIVTLEGDGELGAAFDYPGAIASTAGDRLVLPYAEGIGIPVDEELGWHNGISRRVRAYGTLSMPIGGVFSDKTGAGWMTILETPDDAALQLSRQGEGRLWTFAPSWDAQLGKFGYARKVRYVFFAQGGHVAMAKRYRAHAKAEGLLKTFVEKRKERPDIDRLIGAVNVWCWENPVKTVEMLQAAGIRRILWSGGGSAAALTELSKNPDVLAGCYDVYQDVYHPDLMAKIGKPGEKGVNGEAWPHDILWTGPTSNDWGRAWSVKATDGSWVYCARMCDARAPDYARRKVGDDLKTKPYRARFIDTTYAAALRECWNPAHPMTRSDCRRHRAALMRVISGELGLVAGSEDGKADAVPVCDYFEGMLSIGPYRVPDSGRNITQIWTNVPAATLTYQVGEKYRLPLWELVFHDCTCAHWYWGDYSNKLPSLWLKRDLFNALYGTMPMFMFNHTQWEKDKERFVASYVRTAPIARATGYSEMTDHQILTEDRTVQRTTFANGVVVTVNFGDTPFRAPDGTVIPPLDVQRTR